MRTSRQPTTFLHLAAPALFLVLLATRLSGETAGPERLLREYLKSIDEASSVESQYTSSLPQNRGYQTVHEYRELAGERRARTEIATFSVGASVPSLITWHITNERGVFFVRPGTKSAILNPVRSSLPVGPSRLPRSEEDAWHFGEFYYRGALKSCSPTTCPATGEPAWEIVHTITNRRPHSTSAYVRYVITQSGDRLVTFGVYDESGAAVSLKNYDVFVLNRRFDGALFDPPADFRYEFPQTAEEFQECIEKQAVLMASNLAKQKNKK